MANIGIISLGCAKNAFDVEAGIANLITAGHVVAGDLNNIDAVIINTCGFIKSARDEADENIAEMIELKKNSNPNLKIIVTGCYSQKFSKELKEKFPKIDSLYGIEMHKDIVDITEKTLLKNTVSEIKDISDTWVEPQNGRFPISNFWTGNLKISEGCNNQCSYCGIPAIRGNLRSRNIELALAEAKIMAEEGVNEINIIAQDITAYGSDLGKDKYLVDLLENLNSINGIEWIRLMYTYPTSIDDSLIEAICTIPKVLHYLDMPIQHSHPEIIKSMNRRGSSEEYLELIQKLREKISDICLRTTFIVGYPGENEEFFSHLLEFAKKAKFDRAGIFGYSPEIDTPAYNLKDRISEEIVNERVSKLKKVLESISANKNKKNVGKNMMVLIEDFDEKYLYGRTFRDALDIDGFVRITSKKARKMETLLGKIIEIKITNTLGIFDLAGYF